MTSHRSARLLSLSVLALTPFLALGQVPTTSSPDRIDGERAGLVILPGHVPAVANRREFDQGEVSADLPFDHVQLLLRRPPGREKALQDAIDAMHNPSSPGFHRWLTAGEFGERFGASDAEIAQVVDWLRSHGLTVEGINDDRAILRQGGPVGGGIQYPDSPSERWRESTCLRHRRAQRSGIHRQADRRRAAGRLSAASDAQGRAFAPL